MCAVCLHVRDGGCMVGIWLVVMPDDVNAWRMTACKQKIKMVIIMITNNHSSLNQVIAHKYVQSIFF